jgi:hypothetical protein
VICIFAQILFPETKNPNFQYPKAPEVQNIGRKKNILATKGATEEFLQ